MLQADDDIYIVDQRWYGPPGKELPWHARYPAYGWGFVLYVTAMLLERLVLRVDLSFQSLVFTLLGVCIVTTRIMRRVDPDRPLLSVLRGYWHELRTPRPAGAGRRGGRDQSKQRLQLSLSRAASPHARHPCSAEGRS
jgi:hypothetical protein